MIESRFIPSVPPTTSVSTQTSVSSSASSVSLLAANPQRRACTLWNDSTQILYLFFGSSAATTSNFTVQVAAQGYYELPSPVFTGELRGIWAAANGSVRITELTWDASAPPVPPAGAHAYWRVLGSNLGAIVASFTAYSAMAFRDINGNTITASGGTPIESGHFSTFDSSKLFDGNSATFFESTSAITYAGYQFTTPQAVAFIGLQKASSMDGSFPASSAIIQWSDDGATWTSGGFIFPYSTINANDTMFWFPVQQHFQPLGAHTYWRCCGSEATSVGGGIWSSIYVAYSAMSFKDATGNVIAASGGTAIDGGSHSSTFTVSNLFDNNNTTFYEANNDRIAAYGYQFPSPQAVAYIGLQKTASMDSSSPASQAMVQFSDDGNLWYNCGIIYPFSHITANDTMYWFPLGSIVL